MKPSRVVRGTLSRVVRGTLSRVVRGTLSRVVQARFRVTTPQHLREMAFSARRSQHARLMDALKLLFTQHGKPPIASAG